MTSGYMSLRGVNLRESTTNQCFYCSRQKLYPVRRGVDFYIVDGYGRHSVSGSSAMIVITLPRGTVTVGNSYPLKAAASKGSPKTQRLLWGRSIEKD